MSHVFAGLHPIQSVQPLRKQQSTLRHPLENLSRRPFRRQSPSERLPVSNCTIGLRLQSLCCSRHSSALTWAVSSFPCSHQTWSVSGIQSPQHQTESLIVSVNPLKP